MHSKALNEVRSEYLEIRSSLISNPHQLIQLESMLTNTVSALVLSNIVEIVRDYDAASALYPFWQNYPPLERGRSPKGDQFPWIEVGEHAVGSKLGPLLRSEFEVEDTGFPTGSDQRFVVRSEAIREATSGISDSAWLLMDIKSVGPRDDADHTVMSHNQVSGSGEWAKDVDGVQNAPMMATGNRTQHPFYPALPPLIVLPNGTVALTVTMAIKPVYKMLPEKDLRWSGQPLSRIDLITIPNGILLTQMPNYLQTYPGLLFPGKDDKGKDPRKVRARVSFKILKEIGSWRKNTVWDGS